MLMYYDTSINLRKGDIALSNRFVQSSAFCSNAQCPAYSNVKPHNIRRFGRTQAGTQRYQYKTSKRTFVETIGGVFYGRHRSQQTILECLALMAERNSLAAIHRVKGVEEETVLAWLQIAASHVGRIEALLLANYCLSRVQLDAMWSYVANKGEKGATKKLRRALPSGGLEGLPERKIPTLT